MRSTPTPYETFRTVKVELRWPRLLRMTTPSKIWMRSLSPSLIFVCTRTVSPTRNAGTWPRASGFTFLVAEDPRDQPRRGLDHRQRRGLTSLQDEVAQGQLLVHVGEDPLVDALVASADQHHPLACGQLLRLALVEARALRREEHHVGAGQPRPRRLDRPDQRLRLHHHSGAAAVGHVVGDAVLAGGELADVHDPRAQEPLLLGLAEE